MSNSTVKATRTIAVQYRRIEGWHVFTSDEVPGLYVAHEDCRTAYEAVPGSIETLVAMNENKRVKVKPTHSFERFLDYVWIALNRIVHSTARLSKKVETATAS